MKVCDHLQELFALGSTKYINNVPSIRDEKNSIKLPGTREEMDGNLEVRFSYAT